VEANEDANVGGAGELPLVALAGLATVATVATAWVSTSAETEDDGVTSKLTTLPEPRRAMSVTPSTLTAVGKTCSLFAVTLLKTS